MSLNLCLCVWEGGGLHLYLRLSCEVCPSVPIVLSLCAPGGRRRARAPPRARASAGRPPAPPGGGPARLWTCLGHVVDVSWTCPPGGGSARPCTSPPPAQPSPTQLGESRARVAARAARRWARSPSAGRTGARAACLWGAAEGGVCSEAGAAERERGGGQGAAAARRPGLQRRRCAQA